MVVRIFRATPRVDRIKDYEQCLIDEVLPHMRATPGCIEARILKSLGVVREILFITIWDNLESVKAFAGQNWNNAVLVGREVEMIEEGTPEVKHYHQLGGFTASDKKT